MIWAGTLTVLKRNLKAMLEINKIHHGDCRQLMMDIESASVDMIFADLPYGTTQNKWDSVLPMNDYYVDSKRNNLTYRDYLVKCFELGISLERAKRIWDEKSVKGLWSHYNRIIKPGGAIVLTAAQPFTSELINSNKGSFKYCWYWQKNRSTGVFNARKQPLRNVEEVVVFNTKSYNPQGLIPYNQLSRIGRKESENYGNGKYSSYVQEFTNYPKQVLLFDSVQRNIHPTQKPVELVEYMINTYTEAGQLVLDNCAGSCTTAVAANKTGRNWICMEKEDKYVQMGRARLLNER